MPKFRFLLFFVHDLQARVSFLYDAEFWYEVPLADFREDIFWKCLKIGVLA